MKPNHDKPLPPWLDDALSTHLAAGAACPPPSPGFSARCRSAAMGALDIIRMREKRAEAHGAGSLFDHFKELARLAGVRLAGVFKTLGIREAEAGGPANATGLARLARQLGLARDEALLRLRVGFARLTGTEALPPFAMNQPVRARGRVSGGNDKLDDKLRQIEVGYTAKRRTELRAAMDALTSEYDGGS